MTDHDYGSSRSRSTSPIKAQSSLLAHFSPKGPKVRKKSGKMCAQIQSRQILSGIISIYLITQSAADVLSKK